MPLKKIEPILNTSKHAARVLVSNDALLVHCAGWKKQCGTTIHLNDPIARLRDAIEHRCNVACSTLQIGDQYPGNLTGALAIIVDPGSVTNITNCCHRDAGTMPNGCKGRTPGWCEDTKTGQQIVGMNLDDAIKNRLQQDYNEICVHSFDVMGLLVCGPFPIRYPIEDPRSEEDRYFDPQPPSEMEIYAADLMTYFPETQIYLWDSASGLHALEVDVASGNASAGRNISLSDLYGV